MRAARIGCFLFMLCGWLVAQAAEEQVRFPWQPGWLKQYDSRSSSGDLTGHLFRPREAGRRPFVVFMHGCGGLNLRNVRHWAEFFVREGVGVLMVDSFTPRERAEACSDREPWFRRRADDATSALQWLANQAFADPQRIALMGQSQGAGALLLALHQGNRVGAGFVGGIAMYPPCVVASSANVKLAKPVIAMIGDADNWTTAAACEAFKATQDERFELVVYPGAAHSFDNPVREMLVQGGKYRVGEHPASRADAQQRVKAFIDARLK
ncbi:MAG: dienelactone hydrolase family protein [Burkholderiales bacterium]|nr:dienelactone hydrolase family protein [Burkholderiales bacterium]